MMPAPLSPGTLVDVGLLLAEFLAVTLILLLPVCLVRVALRRADPHVAAAAKAARQGLADARIRAFAQHLLRHPWTIGEVKATVVCSITAGAAVLAFVASGYVLETIRPTIADPALPWLLGTGLVASVAWAYERRRAEPWVAYPVVILCLTAIALIALLRSEATTTDPAIYGTSHPWKDRMFFLTWLTMELGLLGGSTLAAAGLEGAVRAIGIAFAGLIELLALLLNWAVFVGEGAVRGFVGGLWLLLGAVFIPAELLYRLIREAVGTDPDGNHRLPPPDGGALG